MSHRLIIIPVFNEEPNIEALHAELRRCYKGEVLFVNDGSTDRSESIIAVLRDGGAHLINHAGNQGYGKSLIDGFEFAKQRGFDQIVTMDCDFQHHPGYALSFFENLDFYDVVSGSRYLMATENDQEAPRDRRSINQKVTEILNSFVPWKITDAFCGFKGYRLSALRKVMLDEMGYAMPIQFWVQACAVKLTVGELTVPRLYPNPAKGFSGIMADPEKRLMTYLSVLQRERARWGV